MKMYELVVLNSVVKELKKLDKPIRIRILTILERIAENPYIGEIIKGDLATIFSYHLTISGTGYRIAYQVREQEIVVVVLQIGAREKYPIDMRY